jgi:hypothetical protein
MKACKRHNEVEIVTVREARCIPPAKLQIREKRWREPAVGEFDHRFRAVYAKYRPIWNVRRKLGGYLPIAAADVEHPFITRKS